MNFNTMEFKALRADVEKALKSVEDKYGITLEAGNINYTNMDFRLTITGTKKSENGISQEQMLFESYSRMYGFDKEDYKKRIIMFDGEYELIGFNPRARKNCCIIRSLKNQKEFVTSIREVRNAMEKAA